MAARTAWIGLGVMGFPMAGHLRRKGGHEVTVYNRSAEKAKAWTAKFEGRHAATPREAAADADVVFACVGN
ncbi:MAG: NAD(P)-binding domain-containing protein, partial [Parvibaculaceae bacterium]